MEKDIGKDDFYLFSQNKLRNEQGLIDHDIFFSILNTNAHLIMKVCDELGICDLLEKIELDKLYDLCTIALKKAILDFDIEKDNIKDYYYDYMINYIKNNIDIYPNIKDKDIAKYPELFKKIDFNIDLKLLKIILKNILTEEEFNFVINIYDGNYDRNELLNEMKNENGIIFRILRKISEKIEIFHDKENIDFMNIGKYEDEQKII